MLISIWILFSLVVSKAFAGLMLSSFVNIKIVPHISSLQDLTDKERIVPVIQEFDNFAKLSSVYPEEFKILEERRTASQFNNKENTVNFWMSKENILKIMKGELVYLTNSYNRHNIHQYYPTLPLISTEDKYFSLYTTNKISRFHPMAETIYLL